MLLQTAALAPSFGLILLLGLRHGLDPDHVAVIDNLTFRAAEDRPRAAPWMGAVFALGHSASVGAIAVGVSLLAVRIVWPAWVAAAMAWASIGLLLLVGVLNLRALTSRRAYVPAGWRQALVPASLRETTHPAAVFMIGVIFGLVFDTATQAATWGLAAASTGGVGGAVAIALTFAAGMIATDCTDSWIVARLLRRRGDAAEVVRYRRGVGWVIVALSFGMAAWATAGELFDLGEPSALAVTTLGAVMAGTILACLLRGRGAGRRPGLSDEASPS